MSQALPSNPTWEEPTQKTVIVHHEPALNKAAYKFCKAVTQNHYENFPVASFILPKPMRPAVEAIYAFSRTADDFADEKEYRGVRLRRLEEWEHYLEDKSRPTHPIFIALQDTIREHNLPLQLFRDLITAFKMDVEKKRYQNFDQVVRYCKHSANPVGRLVLHLFKQDTKENLKLSDYICTALQLTNFWQDVAIDLKKDRIYLPQDEMERFSITDQDLFSRQYDENFRRLLAFQISRTKEIFMRGKPLGLHLTGKLGIEIRLTWLTGMTILKKISQNGHDVFNNRPKLSKWDFVKMFFIAINKKSYAKYQ